jgi:putative SOS response-associated peptidase YedK
MREIGKIFNAVEIESDLAPSYNIAPRQPIAVIMEKGKRKLVIMQWGLIPHWSKDESVANKLINARSETLIEKPSFRNAFKKQRCLIIADGFYEWQGTGMGKKPFYIFLKDENPFAMAGLYENWTNPEGKIITSCTIVTTEANEFMKPLHHRMPVIVRPADYGLWLNPLEMDFDKLNWVFSSIDSDSMKAFEVSVQVNLVANNSENCIRPMGENK